MNKREYHRNKVTKLKESVACMDCGNFFPGCVMDFDHRDPHTKRANISKLLLKSWSEILEEIDKCDLVCANCHRLRTYNRPCRAWKY